MFPPTNTNFIDSPLARLWFHHCHNNVLVHFQKSSRTIEDFEHYFKTLDQILNGNKTNLLVYNYQVTNTPNQLKDYIGQNWHKYFHKTAVIEKGIKWKILKILLSSRQYRHLNINVFKNEADAILWINQ